MSADLIAAALDYVGRGWPVFPLHNPTAGGCSCGRSCASPAKHPRTAHGLDDATIDTAQIEAWWKRWPLANIGLRTGVAFDVIDIDDPDVALAALAAHGPLDGGADCSDGWDGPEAITAKGFHRLVIATGHGNRARLVPGVDYRGVGGYIVAPPSVHATGHVYQWGPGGCDVPLEPLPGWFADLLAGKTARPTAPRRLATVGPMPASVAGLVGTVAAAPDGKRNDALNWAAFKVRQAFRERKLTGPEAEEAWATLHRVAVANGLTEAETEATIRSAIRGRRAAA